MYKIAPGGDYSILSLNSFIFFSQGNPFNGEIYLSPKTYIFSVSR